VVASSHKVTSELQPQLQLSNMPGNLLVLEYRPLYNYHYWMSQSICMCAHWL